MQNDWADTSVRLQLFRHEFDQHKRMSGNYETELDNQGRAIGELYRMFEGDGR